MGRWWGGIHLRCVQCVSISRTSPNRLSRFRESPPGAQVPNVAADVSAAYREAQDAAAAGAPTAAILLARKLLMNIAVDKGADPGKGFAEYVEYLADTGYVPPDGRAWVDHIRQKGNEALMRFRT
jgi:hypothetical protein